MVLHPSIVDDRPECPHVHPDGGSSIRDLRFYPKRFTITQEWCDLIESDLFIDNQNILNDIDILLLDAQCDKSFSIIHSFQLFVMLEAHECSVGRCVDGGIPYLVVFFQPLNLIFKCTIEINKYCNSGYFAFNASKVKELFTGRSSITGRNVLSKYL